MDSFTFHDIRVEKANAISKYRRLQILTNLFRLVELFVFVIVVSRFSSQFTSSLKVSGEYFRGITLALISPRFVFLLGNAIVLVLFFKSGRFSAYNCDKIADHFYEEYIEKYRKINSQKLAEKKASEAKRMIIRSRSENLDRDRPQDLRRTVTEVRRNSPDSREAIAEDEMSSEEFRRTVEEFIARQQRFLRED